MHLRSASTLMLPVCAAACLLPIRLLAGPGLPDDPPVAEKATKTAWTKLYNGKDLDNWHVEGEGAKKSSWKADGNILACIAPSGGYLCPEKEYGDFELRLEYRIPPAGNSGVGIRFPRGGWPSTQGIEVQILDDTDPKYKDLKPDQANGSLYGFFAPKAKPAKPAGQWNKIVIRCQGPKIVVHINGTEVQNVDIDANAEKKNKGKTLLGERPRKGLVGLQSHGDRVDFRNIEIREIAP